jgi:hypothetical protein
LLSCLEDDVDEKSSKGWENTISFISRGGLSPWVKVRAFAGQRNAKPNLVVLSLAVNLSCIPSHGSGKNMGFRELPGVSFLPFQSFITRLDHQERKKRQSRKEAVA